MTNQVGDTTKGFGGPETLREWAKNHTHLFEDEEEFIVAAADAWDADKKFADDSNDTVAQLHHELVALRNRLEAARGAAEKLGPPEDSDFGIFLCCGTHEDWRANRHVDGCPWLALNAALAGEERP